MNTFSSLTASPSKPTLKTLPQPTLPKWKAIIASCGVTRMREHEAASPTFDFSFERPESDLAQSTDDRKVKQTGATKLAVLTGCPDEA